MGLNSKVEYEDLENVNKIVITKDMLNQISKYYFINQGNIAIDYDFDCINIEIFVYSKINIFIQRETDVISKVIFFSDELKLISFEMETALDDFFFINEDKIVEYESLENYIDTSESLILFVLNWYPMIIYYIEQHSLKDKSSTLENMTFFINTPNNKFLKENKKKKK